MATLSTLRADLAYLTGRRGLAADTDLCDRLLNAGCRHLDTLQDHPQTQRRRFFKPAADSTLLALPDLRAVIDVWVSNGEDRGKLAFIEYENGKAEGFVGGDELPAGTPTAYTIAPAGLAPDQYDQTSADFVTAGYDASAYADISFALDYANQVVQWFPATDGTWTFDLLGKFWSRTLTDSATTNWWSVNYPMTVVYAAAMLLAGERGNPQLAGEWRNLMQLGLNSVDVALAESEMSMYEHHTDMHMQG